MKNLLFIFSIASCAFSVISCKSNQLDADTKSEYIANTVHSCEQGNVRITTDFPSGRMGECKLIALNEYEITLIPEGTPINSSPWYAFKVAAEERTSIKINMLVQGDKHRYPPKVSANGKTWKLQPYKMAGEELVMHIEASNESTYIAGQEIIDNQYYIDWAQDLSKKYDVIHTILGQSTQGKPIYKIESKQQDNNEWLVIFGRQHPPEVTGALALFPFTETLLSTTELSKKYKDRFNILIIPNINPDGIELGNWRFNANNIDLNRDWQNFSQVETQQIDQYLEQLVDQGQKIKFAIDFHSTRHDVFYTMPVDYGVEAPYFVIHWLKSLDELMPNFDVVMEPGNTPNNGVSKQYFADKFGIHAITYEMGDNTDRYKIIDIANKAANTLMESMLSSTNHNIE